MNLLPKSTKDFGSKDYWNKFFEKRKDTFEWYGEYSDLCGILHKYCKPKDRVLVAGNLQISHNFIIIRNITVIHLLIIVISQYCKKYSALDNRTVDYIVLLVNDSSVAIKAP